MFELRDAPFEIQELAHDGAGGFVSFVGKVREESQGRRVLRLEYEAYPEMAVSEGEALAREAQDRFGLLGVEIIHRTGVLQIGEPAVSIQVAAAHRREAFAGCEWIIDQLKYRVPIWKREVYEDGDSGWVGADPAPRNMQLYDALTERQRRLGEVGEDGQRRLREARVLLVGVGGLGSASLPYLVGAGIGSLGLVDPDDVEISNLHRQILYGTDEIGRSKVERAAAFARRLNPEIQVEVHPVSLDAANVHALVESYDWIVDGTDSLEVKFLLNSACRRAGKPFVTASVHRFEGHLMTVMPEGPCLRCLFPDVPPSGCVGTCAEVGVLGVVPGLFGILQANEVLKGILGYGDVLAENMVMFDLRTNESTTIRRKASPRCPICTGAVEEAADSLEVESLEAASKRFKTFEVIDIREHYEEPPLPVPHRRAPMSAYHHTPTAKTVILVCAHGIRSYALAARLRHYGFLNVYSLRGGLESIHRKTQTR
ncbi:MAG: ThiF family adenylyltransferase [Fimbriimonadaceae bacterium]|nr:ThiF family adenylyltransferase [Fimbriimonadaceae bacterium]